MATGFRLDVNGTDNGTLEQIFAEIGAIRGRRGETIDPVTRDDSIDFPTLA